MNRPTFSQRKLNGRLTHLMDCMIRALMSSASNCSTRRKQKTILNERMQKLVHIHPFPLFGDNLTKRQDNLFSSLNDIFDLPGKRFFSFPAKVSSGPGNPTDSLPVCACVSESAWRSSLRGERVSSNAPDDAGRLRQCVP